MAKEEFFKFAGRVQNPSSIAVGGEVPPVIKNQLPEIIRQRLDNEEIGLFMDYTGNYFIFNKCKNTVITSDASWDYTREGEDFLSRRRGGE